MIIRLNRYLSICGVSSRRKADRLIEDGRVRVNGVIVREPGYRVDTDKDRVSIGRRVLKPQKKRYVILNKPRLYLTSLGDERDGKRSIRELIRDIPERVYPAGRLDYDAEGLLMLTNDGEVANRILHPRYKLPKVYLTLVKGALSSDVLEKGAFGIKLEDGLARPDWIKILGKKNDNTVLEVAFHEGRKHLVKRFFKSMGYPVLRLKRVAIGPIRLGNLPRGKWRDLTPEELEALKRSLGFK
jgi:23S rRNA pseudouridine2605 synthase